MSNAREIVIETVGLSKAFGSVYALNRVDLQIRSGEYFVLVVLQLGKRIEMTRSGQTQRARGFASRPDVDQSMHCVFFGLQPQFMPRRARRSLPAPKPLALIAYDRFDR